MATTALSPTFRSLIASFTDFLTVAIHSILYERELYPRTSFLSARKYNFPVRQSRHPKVCEWINDAVAAVEAELLHSTVERVAVVIYNRNNVPLERFLFDLSRFPTVAVSEIDTLIERISPDGQTVAVLPVVDMEEQFRATMSKIANCGSVLKPLPDGCTFTVSIELKSDGNAPIGHAQPWMPVEKRKQPKVLGSELQPKTTPIRSVSAGDMVFEAWVEEAQD